MADRGRPKYRLYVPDPLAEGGAVSLLKDQAHYLSRVMRAEIGQEVALFNGQDGEWLSEIASLTKTSAALTLTHQMRPQSAEPDLWLLFAPIKKDRMDFLVEKAVELGASALQPVLAAQSQVARVREDRLVAQSIEAAEQCERLSLPDIKPLIKLETLLESWGTDRHLVFLDESGQGAPLQKLAEEIKDQPLAFLIGPEGGFTQKELDALRTLPFSSAASLGPRILRAETAALASLACWQSLAGDWR